jgi:hypothetical protein
MNYCIVLTAPTEALSFFQNPALDRESNPHAILTRIWFFNPLKLQKRCGLDWRIYGIRREISLKFYLTSAFEKELCFTALVT